MIGSHALLVAGVALYVLAGSALLRRIVRRTNDRSQHRRPGLLLPALGAALAFACIAGGAAGVYGELTPPVAALPLWSVVALSVAAPGLLAAALVAFAAFPPPPGGDDGGSGPGGPAPPPDPDGPDSWAEFERRFRAYARARDGARSAAVLRV